MRKNEQRVDVDVQGRRHGTHEGSEWGQGLTTIPSTAQNAAYLRHTIVNRLERLAERRLRTLDGTKCDKTEALALDVVALVLDRRCAKGE